MQPVANLSESFRDRKRIGIPEERTLLIGTGMWGVQG